MDELETGPAVRTWLRTLPGMVEAGDSQEVMRKAWGMFGKGNLELFRIALAKEGFKPEALGRMFILRLPSKPTGSADWDRIRRMNNMTGS